MTARLTWILILGQISAVSQTPLEFEVASIRLAQRDSGTRSSPPSFRRNAGRIDYSSVSLSELVLRAFDVPGYRVVWPDRLSEQRQATYDISAVLPSGSTPSQLGPMLQHLLAGRLGFTAHWEKRNLPCYVMTVAKSGLKMPKSKYDASADAGDPGEEPRSKNRYKIFQGPAEERISGAISIAQLAAGLGAQIGRPILDQTGIEGYFDIDFTWSKPLERASPRYLPDPDGQASTPAISHIAALLPALEKQLGLKAEPRNDAMDVLAIDRVNTKPTPN